MGLFHVLAFHIRDKNQQGTRGVFKPPQICEAWLSFNTPPFHFNYRCFRAYATRSKGWNGRVDPSQRRNVKRPNLYG